MYESDLQCRNIIIVYDSNTSSLQEYAPATNCARLLSESGSKNSVKILKGGYETFSRHYPFLRTQQIIYMPKVKNDINLNNFLTLFKIGNGRIKNLSK